MKTSEDNVKMNLWCVEVVRIGGGVNWLRISSAECLSIGALNVWKTLAGSWVVLS
jgi:hypothetical protein